MEKHTVLIAHSNPYLIEEITNYFSSFEEFIILSARNGQESLDQLKAKEVNALVIDFSIRECTFIEVIKSAKLKHPDIKIILSLNSQSALSLFKITIQDLIKIGVSDFVTGQLKPEAIKRSLDSQQNVQKLMLSAELNKSKTDKSEVEIEQLDEYFAEIPLDEVPAENPMLFDLYLKLRKNKYIKVLHAGESLDPYRKQSYAEKKVSALFYQTSERLKYISLCNFLAAKFLEDPQASESDKVKQTKVLIENTIDEVYFAEITPALLNKSMEMVSVVYDFVSQDDVLYNFFQDYIEENPSEKSHTFMVIIFTALVAHQRDWGNIKARENLALAALLHDLGLKKLEQDLLSKDKSTFTDEEREVYETHPQLGAQLVQESQIVPPVVSQTILEHHELLDGSGFPHKSPGEKLSPPGKILSFTNAFAHYIAEEKVTPKEGIKSFMNIEGIQKKYEIENLQAIVSLFFKFD